MSKAKLGADVGAVDGAVATGGPAVAAGDELRVRNFADDDVAGSDLHLRMAFQTEVVVAFGEERAIDGTVRLMANGAAFAEGFVFVNEGA